MTASREPFDGHKPHKHTRRVCLGFNLLRFIYCKVYVSRSPKRAHSISTQIYLENEGSSENQDFHVVPLQEGHSTQR